ncbi:MAG: hypothetical protein JWO86_7906 [Myxococcaceae bacterium]|nr:hypothetical protein [Myxococcaceae bacterium]
MRVAPSPRLHLFVCANRREGSPLGPGCGERGEALYDALKEAVATRRAFAAIWVTKTHCLGICPKRGATVARYPSPEPILADVEVGDVEALLAGASPPEPQARGADSDWDSIERELLAIEELQTQKVLDLARRLKPGLTMEDVQNPHDFPELDDPDWHYADGILTGIKSVTSAMRALKQRGRGE